MRKHLVIGSAAALFLSACGGREAEDTSEALVEGGESVPITREDGGEFPEGELSAEADGGATARDRPNSDVEITSGVGAASGSGLGASSMESGKSAGPSGGKTSKLQKMDPAS